ncbi:MAG: hypothetical protein KAX38_04605, partial [Candidatus Krumholzibacteria bacterium]|nr:hypothetical protein [Candidatus Krumholzibacteria bacterium]
IGTGVSWLHIDGAMPWDKPGGDYAEGLLDEQSVDGNSTVSFTLPNALVLNWIRYPSKNHGVIIKIRDTSGDTFRLVSSRETGTPGHRPKLWLKYLKSG